MFGKKKPKEYPTLGELINERTASETRRDDVEDIIELTDIVQEKVIEPLAAPPPAEPKPKKEKKKPHPAKKKARRPPARSGGFGLPWEFRIFFFLLPILVVPVFAGFLVYQHYLQDLPSIDALKKYAPDTVTYVYSADGRVIGEFYKEHRIVVPLKQIPRHVVAAFLAAEDANFFNHPGLDLVGIARAMWANYRAKRIVQGASTITQQVTRSFLLTRTKSYDRKIKEALLAFQIEQNLGKEEILNLYLNQIYLGRGAYGVESAAQRYFGKNVCDLTIAEAALIAGMARAPGRYSPFRTPELARERQMYVLNRMMEDGFISHEEGLAAKQEELRFKNRPDINMIITPGFTEQVRRESEAMLGPEKLYNQGLTIYATVDVGAQEMAHNAIRRGLDELTHRQGFEGSSRRLNKPDMIDFLARQAEWLRRKPLVPGIEVMSVVTRIDPPVMELSIGNEKGQLDKKGMAWALRGRGLDSLFSVGDILHVVPAEKDPATGLWTFQLGFNPIAQAALVCIETKSGRVRAAVGGRDWSESQFNRAVQAKRQPGSSFKPFVYATAMDSGFTQASVINDEPTVYKDQGGKDWSPRNYGRGYSGPITLFQALIRSVNVVAVKLNEKVGPEKVVEYAHRMGIKSELGPNLSLALGTSEVTPLEMAAAFGTFPNQGNYIEPTFISRIEDRDGNILTEWHPQPKRAISEETAFIVLDMLRNVVRMGTGARVNALGRPVAGKTGTTNDHVDAWFVGFTPDYSTSVWVGRDEHKPLGRGEQGGRTAAPIFLYFMKEFLQDKPVLDFPIPGGVVRRSMAAIRDGSTDGEESGNAGRYVYLTFKKGEEGRGRSELPGRPAGYERATAEAPDDIEERLRRQMNPTPVGPKVQAKAGN